MNKGEQCEKFLEILTNSIRNDKQTLMRMTLRQDWKEWYNEFEAYVKGEIKIRKYENCDYLVMVDYYY